MEAVEQQVARETLGGVETAIRVVVEVPVGERVEGDDEHERGGRSPVEQCGERAQPMRPGFFGTHRDLEVHHHHADDRECPGDVEPDDPLAAGGRADAVVVVNHAAMIVAMRQK